MQVTVKGKNTDVPEGLRSHTERKLAKVLRFDDRIVSMDVEFSEERNPRVADAHRVEVTLTTKSRLVRAHASATDPTAAVDQVVDRLERQVKKLKGRRLHRSHHGDGKPAAAGEPPAGAPVEQAASPIVRYKKVELEAMTPEEAVDRLDLLGHDFYMFTNAETERANVVYRRRSGDFGLIEPQA